MRDFKLLANSDIALENGDFVIAEGTPETAQAAQIRLKVRQGEWHQNVMDGIDWDQLYAANTSMAHKEMLLRKAVQNTPGVKKIHKFTLKKEPSSGDLVIEMTVSTDYTESENINITL